MRVEVDRDLGPIDDLEEGGSVNAIAQGITLGRVSRGEDVAAFGSYLAGPDANCMTRKAPLVVGGMLFV